MARYPARVIVFSLTAVAALVSGLLAVDASQPFSPTLDVGLANSNLSANSDVTSVMTLTAGSHALGNWALDLPLGWGVTKDTFIPYGDVVAQGNMSVDVDCDSTIDNFGFFFLSNQPADPSAVGEWQGHITSWWPFTIAVDGNSSQGFDMSADLTNFSEFHALCAPQTLSLTIFGRSSPGNAAVLTNPSSAGTYTFTSSLVSLGGEHTAQPSDAVCVCPDSDGDGVIDEVVCGSDPADPTKRPERIDGVFSGVDDDGDTLVDESLPAGSLNYDCDGDGYTGAIENHVYAPSTLGDQDPCGGGALSQIGWPNDLTPDNQLNIGDFNSFVFPLRLSDDGHGAFHTFGHPVPDVDWGTAPWDLDPDNMINIGDINSFIFPLRSSDDGHGTFNKFGHPVPDSDPDIARWDLDSDNMINIGDINSFIFPLRPFDNGHGTFNKFGHPVPDTWAGIARWDLDPNNIIDLGDLNAINPAVFGSTARPPMFAGQPAFVTDPDGPGPMTVGQCPWPP